MNLRVYLDTLKWTEQNGMKQNRMEWNGTEWNRASIPLFAYFMMERNKTSIPLFGK